MDAAATASVFAGRPRFLGLGGTTTATGTSGAAVLVGRPRRAALVCASGGIKARCHCVLASLGENGVVQWSNSRICEVKMLFLTRTCGVEGESVRGVVDAVVIAQALFTTTPVSSQ